MDENSDDINKKTSILLSRNSPIALVVGAAGFLGSHLVDKLLDKGIQVIGVDDLESGKRVNLRKATQNRNFHLIIESPDKLDLDLQRFDYLFITTSGKCNLGKILELFKKFKCRCLFISSIDLYDKDNTNEELKQLRQVESKIAKFAAEKNLNARILRLGPVYGPGMDFKTKDPIVKLISQALNGDLQKEVSLEFSSRALYFADAVDLIIKTIFAGSTAQKIFDGVLPAPVKVSEIKQVLLDPVWYETKDFTPSELPPWPTPNLDKTVKFLNWHPRHQLVVSLKETLSYFKDNEIDVPKLEVRDEKLETGEKAGDWDKEKKAALEAFKQESKKEPMEKFKFPLRLSRIYLFLVVALVTYALIWPGLVLGWGVLTFRSQLSQGLRSLQKGEFDKSLTSIRQAEIGLRDVKSIFGSLDPIRKTGLFKQEFEWGDNLINLSALSVSSIQKTALGVQALFKAVRAVTGELTESPVAYFSSAQIELSSASEDLSKATVLSGKTTMYSGLLEKARVLSVLLPRLVALEGSKDYLVLLQNNMELRPGGGFIGSFAKISFEKGKLKKLEVNDIYAIDGQLSIHVEPPKEIKEDLGQKDWYLRDSNWEPDFPTSARQAEWFYTKETGERVEGVVALDISAIEELLASVGPLDLADYEESITADNLFEKAVSHAENNFFPGSQAKKSFLTALTNELFNKIFFLPQNNWPGIVSALGRALDEKHVSIYLDDPILFSFLSSEGWTHTMPRPSTEKRDFLSLVEANLGANKVNYYLDRSYNLETVVGKDGEVKHRMRVSYVNRSPSDAFPGGKYKNRMRVYLPFGTKLTRVLWGEADITKNVSSFVDYGRSGYSFMLELAPKEQKNLVLDYSLPLNLEFKEGKTSYTLDVVKQPGTMKDPFTWTITYPINYRLVSNQAKLIGPQEQTISTDLSTDRSFEVEFKK